MVEIELSVFWWFFYVSVLIIGWNDLYEFLWIFYKLRGLCCSEGNFIKFVLFVFEELSKWLFVR